MGVFKLFKRKYGGIEKRKAKQGLMFVLPWIIGFILFFLLPLFQSLLYSFSNVKITENGVETAFVAMKNYYYILMEDPNYMIILKDSLVEFLYSMPLILVVSMVLAIILNQHFRGRFIFRAMFFLPVIIASGVVLDILFSTTSSSLTEVGVSQSLTAGMLDISDITNALKLPANIAEYVTIAISNIFD